MAYIQAVHGISPTFGNACYLAPNATIVGDVTTGDECSIWFQAVVRGDVNNIRIGHRVNIQDAAIIHCTYQKAATTIGDNVSIGHRAIIHGCTIGPNTLIGMGAIIMDHAIVEEGCLVAAGALVTENSHLKSGYIYAGVPARPLKPLTPSTNKDTIARIANNYIMYASWYTQNKTC